MSDSSVLRFSEFLALKRLYNSEQATINEDELKPLVARHFIRRTEKGWGVTVDGHAAYLHEVQLMIESGYQSSAS